MKKPAFPNDQFVSQDHYFKFAFAHKVFGADAYVLKKKLDKQSDLLIPVLKPPKKVIQ